MKNAITWHYTFETKNYPSTIIGRKKVHKTPEVYGRKEGRKELLREGKLKNAGVRTVTVNITVS